MTEAAVTNTLRRLAAFFHEKEDAPLSRGEAALLLEWLAQAAGAPGKMCQAPLPGGHAAGPVRRRPHILDAPPQDRQAAAWCHDGGREEEAEAVKRHIQELLAMAVDGAPEEGRADASSMEGACPRSDAAAPAGSDVDMESRMSDGAVPDELPHEACDQHDAHGAQSALDMQSTHDMHEAQGANEAQDASEAPHLQAQIMPHLQMHTTPHLQAQSKEPHRALAPPPVTRTAKAILSALRGTPTAAPCAEAPQRAASPPAPRPATADGPALPAYSFADCAAGREHNRALARHGAPPSIAALPIERLPMYTF